MRLDHGSQLFQRRSRRQRTSNGWFGIRIGKPAGEDEDSRCQRHYDGGEIVRALVPQRLYALDHFNGIPDGAPERRVHIGYQRLRLGCE